MRSDNNVHCMGGIEDTLRTPPLDYREPATFYPPHSTPMDGHITHEVVPVALGVGQWRAENAEAPELDPPTERMLRFEAEDGTVRWGFEGEFFYGKRYDSKELT